MLHLILLVREGETPEHLIALGSPTKGYPLQLQSESAQMTQFSVLADMKVETPLSGALTHEPIQFLVLILPIQSVI